MENREKKSISVIVPVYNTKKFLKDCLDSIVLQSYGDFEIILVDDGSTDGCEQICDRYAERDTRIQVIHQPNRGLVNARKAGLRVAQGDYIYYVDSDDWLDKNVIETFILIIQEQAPHMISVGIKREYGHRVQIDSVPFRDGLYTKKKIREILIPELINTEKFFEWGQHLTYWHYLIRKTLLLENQQKLDDEIRMAEDIACVYPCILDAGSIYICSDVYYHYRQRNDSMKWTEVPNEYDNLKKVYKVLGEKLLNQDDKNVLMKMFTYLILFEILTSVPEKMLFQDGTFPYKKFPEHSKVVVYGAGLFGNKVIEALQRSRYAEIVAWSDRNYVKYQEEGFDVIAPDNLRKIEYDYILIAVIRADIRERVLKALPEYGVSSEKVINIDMHEIECASLPDEFII